jgi:hypothetical protein
LHHAPNFHGITATETFTSTVILFC